MKTINFLLPAVTMTLVAVGCQSGQAPAGGSEPIDYDAIRGFNYTPAGVAAPRHHVDSWVRYDERVTDFDLDLARGLNLNQTRVFVNYPAFEELGEALASRLQHFVRAAHERGIGVMPVVGNGPWVRDTTQRAQARVWAEFLVGALKDEPGLAMWDVMNEPDYSSRNDSLRRVQNYDNCRFMSRLFHELDPDTPVTIGMAGVDGMIEMADWVDVLQFHDYSPTRAEIASTIERAKEFAASTGKPLINGEIGCLARANPYDVTLEEHMKAGVGWYIWELMVVRDGWGSVHGVFYEDGTVRDPSIAAAIMGYFRNRENILPEVPDREGMVTRTVAGIERWLASPTPDWNNGLDLAETAANLMESSQTVAMIVPPTYEVAMLRKDGENLPALKTLLQKYVSLMTPYMLPQR